MNSVLVPRSLTGTVLARATAGLAAVTFAVALSSCSFSVGDLRSVGEEESAPAEAAEADDVEETEEAEAVEQSEEGEAEEVTDGLTMPVDPADAEVWDDATYWLSGSGDVLYELEWTPQTNAVLELTHTGVSNFIVVPYDAEGTRMGNIANEIGATEMEFALTEMDLFGGAEDIEYIHIQADGDWTISR